MEKTYIRKDINFSNKYINKTVLAFNRFTENNTSSLERTFSDKITHFFFFCPRPRFEKKIPFLGYFSKTNEKMTNLFPLNIGLHILLCFPNKSWEYKLFV
jgi:hypothetical protein